MTDLPPIPPCKCGSPAILRDNRDSLYWVRCSEIPCWMGPDADTPEEAIRLWSEVMGDAE